MYKYDIATISRSEPLVVYAIVLIVFLLAEIALIIFAAVFPDTFKDTVQQGMYKSLDESYDTGIGINGTQLTLPVGATELSWDLIQYETQCCGAYNYSDYQKIGYSQTIRINQNQQFTSTIPVSCCRKKDDAGTTPTSESDFMNLDACLRGDTQYINDKDCYETSIADFVNDYKYIAIGIAIGICVIELLLIIFAFCLCARANDDKYV